MRLRGAAISALLPLITQWRRAAGANRERCVRSRKNSAAGRLGLNCQRDLAALRGHDRIVAHHRACRICHEHAIRPRVTRLHVRDRESGGDGAGLTR